MHSPGCGGLRDSRSWTSGAGGRISSSFSSDATCRRPEINLVGIEAVPRTGRCRRAETFPAAAFESTLRSRPTSSASRSGCSWVPM